MKRRKKMTPEEWRAELERRADLDRRLLEMIERYRELNARKRAAGSRRAAIASHGVTGAREARVVRDVHVQEVAGTGPLVAAGGLARHPRRV